MINDQPLFSRLQLAWLASALRDAEGEFAWASDRAIVKHVAQSLGQALFDEGSLRDKDLWLNSIFHAGEIHAEPLQKDKRKACHVGKIRR
jgi:hypothetical protein